MVLNKSSLFLFNGLNIFLQSHFAHSINLLADIILWWKVKSCITMTTDSKHLASSYAILLHSEFLLFVVCSKQLHPIPRAPGSRPVRTLRFRKLLCPNVPGSVAHGSPGEDTCKQIAVLACSGPLPVVRNQDDVYFTSAQTLGAQ